MKTAVFWVVATCGHVIVTDFSEVLSAYLADDGGKYLWNVSTRVPDYTAEQPVRQCYSST
jgi:hypothetical protein